ncbi:unnamed protein product [Dibothriocephalus latus]|uniref:Uncharacterized protein n=1 Tax=Dibothriocephalus latus TaxID=60516 RepID=A0A3P7LQD9_DIBLA|nr:unnamed protein product [Dibothriocephalus latus]
MKLDEAGLVFARGKFSNPHAAPSFALPATSIAAYLTAGGGSFHSPHDGPGSPYSGSRSDLLMDDVDSNFESIRDQMRRMEERVASMSAIQMSGQDSVSPGLREQNTRLNATIAILEERLKEAESRYERDLESERNHMESLMVIFSQILSSFFGVCVLISTSSRICTQLHFRLPARLQ